MFDHHLASFRQELDTIRQSLRISDQLRETLSAYDRSVGEKRADSNETIQQLVGLKSNTTSLPSWRIFEHCSVITRLYATYEKVVTDVIVDWLSRLPTLFPKYDDLPKPIQKEHLAGACRILPVAGTDGRFASLVPKQLVDDLHHAMNSVDGYRLTPEFFKVTESTFRDEAIATQLHRVGIVNGWQWIEKHPPLTDFISTVLADVNSAKGYLREFVKWRNAAAHGRVIEVLSVPLLLEAINFIDAVSVAIIECCNYHDTLYRIDSGEYKELASVTEHFRHGAFVGVMSHERAKVGWKLIVVRQHRCYGVAISSLMLDDDSYEVIRVESGREVGFVCDSAVKSGSRLYVRKSDLPDD